MLQYFEGQFCVTIHFGGERLGSLRITFGLLQSREQFPLQFNDPRRGLFTGFHPRLVVGIDLISEAYSPTTRS